MYDGDTITLEADELGKLRPRNQVTDYMFRGEALADYNVIEFFVDTYEDRVKGDNTDSHLHMYKTGDKQKRGRPCHERVPYLPGHPTKQTKQRVVRGQNHNNLPNFIGRYFPPRDDPDQYPFYCASMLMLLKPWRDVKTDLKKSMQTWEEALEEFLETAPAKVTDILSGIQYYHMCHWSAKQQAQNLGIWEKSMGTEMEEMQVDGEKVATLQQGSITLSEEGLRRLQASEEPTMEDLHAFSAIESARFAKLFEEDSIELWTEAEKRSNTELDLQFMLGGRRCDDEDVQNMLQWKTQMEADVERQNIEFDATSFIRASEEDFANVIGLDILSNDIADIPGVTYVGGEHRAEEALAPVDPSMLRYDQYRAYDIITGHLQETLAGRNPPPLRMLIHGEPGTGKSKVIQTTTQHFISRDAKHMLMKSAYTGVASSVIDGKTTHSIAMISPRRDGCLSAKSRRKLQKIWKHIKYLVIDEVSMISKTFLAKLSRNISIGKMSDREDPSPDSFGGISVILCGDFFQFPPVVGGVSDALYNPVCQVPKNRVDSQAG